MIVALAILRRGLALLPTVAAMMALAVTTAHAQQVKIPGTTVSLSPPAGFSVATGFAGLVHKEKSASILVVEFPPVAQDQMDGLFSSLENAKTNFARRQVLIDTLETLDLPAGKVPFATGTQDAGAVTLDKWIALLKGPMVVLLTVQAPQQVKLDTAAVKTMLSSVVLGEVPSIAEKLQVLPFTIVPAEPYRVIDTLGGFGVLMTIGPLDADPTNQQPSIVIVHEQSPAYDARNIEFVSDYLLKGTHGYAEAIVTAKEQTPFAGISGLRTLGTRKTSAGEKQFVHYLAISAEGRQIRMLASGDEQQMRELQAAVDAIAKSITLNSN